MKKKMKALKITGLLALLVFNTVLVFAEVTVKEIKTRDGSRVSIFYSNGKEIAKLLRNKYDFIQGSTGKIPDGIVTQYYKSGKIKEETKYKNGWREGMSRTYYESGMVKEELTYKDDRKHKKYRRFAKDNSGG